tara:strand:+ start:34 stop:828 length:795 start_codon:yes stop_codon:yes gene_type:complete
MPRNRRKSKKRALPIYHLFPSIMTIIGICVGLFALKAGMVHGQWEQSVILMIIAGIIDGLDGKIARVLNASSPFGAQLDSLADFLNFGVVPALIVYSWITHEFKGVGWAVALFFIICQAIRLARFNAKMEMEYEIPELKDKFFEGIAAPMGAALSLLPMMLHFLFEQKFETPPFQITASLVILYVSFIALMMISTFPTFSLKGLNIPRRYTSILLGTVGFFVIAAITEPWITFPFIGFLYFLTFPWCYYRYLAIKKNAPSTTQA